MIYVNRARVKRPSNLDKKNRAGLTEKERAILFHADPINVGQTFDFKVYSDAEVKDTLTKLFYGKCAYCETSFLATYPGDVEHFRPKAEIEEGMPDKKPGYYWLASDWDNLLLSCRNCNQKLSHIIYGNAEKKTMGKMNQFPLSLPGVHVRRHDHPNGILDEETFRLLINPCIDNPETHLEYGDEGVIRPRKDVAGKPSPKGKTSISVYVLQRVYLVQSREKVMVEIQAQIQRLKEATTNYNDYVNGVDTVKKFYFEKILKQELKRLKMFLDPKEEYVGMARQIIGSFLMSNFGVSL